MSTGKHQTQWAGQFGVAHELTRRGYLVTFTMGNAPAADLLCESPGRKSFPVQVKSLRSRNYFLYQESLLETSPDLCFIFVLVPDDLTRPPEYFVLNNAQFHATVQEEDRRLKEQEKTRGRPYKPFSPGVHYRTLNRDEFRNAWQNLPE